MIYIFLKIMRKVFIVFGLRMTLISVEKTCKH